LVKQKTMDELLLDIDPQVAAAWDQRTALVRTNERMPDTGSNAASVAFTRTGHHENPLLKSGMHTYKLFSKKFLEKILLDLPSKVANIYFGSPQRIDPVSILLRLFVLERKKKMNDRKTGLLLDILEKVNSTEDCHVLDSKIILSGLHLASELSDICETIDWYASPNNSLTFELLFDGKRATVIHGKMNSLVISNHDDMDWASYPNTPEGIEALKEKISNF
jgi:hypothetical protein